MVKLAKLNTGGIKVVLSGNVTFKEIIDFKTKVNNHPDFKSFRYQLVIFDSIEELKLSTENIISFSILDREAVQRNPQMKIAFVTNDPLTYGFSRMYQSFMCEKTWEIMIFENENEAEKWINS